jgi:hypothetical protein
MNTSHFSHHRHIRHALCQLPLALLLASLLSVFPSMSGTSHATSQPITAVGLNFMPNLIGTEQLHADAYTTRQGVGLLAEVCSEGVAPIGGTSTCTGGLAEVCSEGVAPIGGTSTCA